MSALSSTKPDAWTLSPQMTAAPELWRNLIHLFPLWEGAGPPGMIASESLPAASLSDGEWVIGSSGIATKATSNSISGAQIDAGDDPRYSILESGNQTTVFAVFDWTVNEQEWIGGVEDEWALLIQSDGTLLFAHFGDNTGSAADIGFGFHAAAAKVDAGTGVDIWLDGNLYKSHSSSNTSSDSGNVLGVGGRIANTGGEIFNQPLYMWGLFDGLMSDADIRKLTLDPFAMLRPAGF